MYVIPKAILFDLDDTLISFDGVAEAAWEKCCGDFITANKTEFTIQTLLLSLQKERAWYWSDPQRHKAGRENLRNARREIVAAVLDRLGIKDIKLSNGLADAYSDYHNELLCLNPNVISTLDALKSAGIRMGLITNGTSEGQREKLKRFSLTEYFEIILIDQELGFGKPEPRVYHHALDELHLCPCDCWMVGDNIVWDIEPPQKIGIYSIWYDYKENGLPQNAKTIPDRIITDISELL